MGDSYTKPRGLVPIHRVTLTAAVQTYDLGVTLSGDLWQGFELWAKVYNPTGGTVIYSLRLNGAAVVVAASMQQSLLSSNTTNTAARSTNPYVFSAITTLETGTAEVLIPFSKSGEGVRDVFVRNVQTSAAATADQYNNVFRLDTPSAATNITSIGIGADTAASIGIGTIFTLYGRTLA